MKEINKNLADEIIETTIYLNEELLLGSMDARLRAATEIVLSTAERVEHATNTFHSYPVEIRKLIDKI